MNENIVSLNTVMWAATRVAEKLLVNFADPDNGKLMIYAIPRGGIAAAGYLLNALSLLGRPAELVDVPQHADIIFDDLVDSGATMARYDDGPFKIALFSKTLGLDAKIPAGSYISKDRWIVFPWELNDCHSAEDVPIRLLQYIGEDPKREGLEETPKRFLNAWREWSSGYTKNPSEILKLFEDGAEKVDELILVRDLPVYSHCEHHLAPFFGVAHIGYVPNGRIVGLSKLSRLVDIFAKRLQVQERLTNQIADALEENLHPLGVGVVLECRHLCMESRGIQRQGAVTTTSAMRGVLRTKPEARAEFLSLTMK